tara:strand:+ start:1746 stop:2651 length:906 start_codon:yes stop_codon:yes gene_type:complete
MRFSINFNFSNYNSMKKYFFILISIPILFSSCISQKKYTALETKQKETKDLLNTATVKLNSLIDEKAKVDATVEALKDQLSFLKANNTELINNMGNLTTLSQQGAENLERSLESLKEKDLRITKMQDAVTRRDSVTLALVTSLKGALVDINDSDIEVNVEKGVVFISISDKLLFRSGSYTVTNRAKEVLGKVARVINDKTEIEFMVEGHTDNVPVKKDSDVLIDNWDLSVKRATAVVRVLQNDFLVDPSRMTAAGRSYYVPIDDNETWTGRAKNRRTRIVVLPKLDQFFDLLEQGMEAASN